MKKVLRIDTAIRRYLQTLSSESSGDIERTLKYLQENCVGSDNAISLKSLIRAAKISKRNRAVSTFQQNVLIPLKNQEGFFVATFRRGVYLPVSPEDFLEALDFYNTRIRAEKRHLKNLKSIAARTSVFSGYELTPEQKKKYRRTAVFFDESGTPALADLNQPLFIVSAVVFDSHKSSMRMLRQKIAYIRDTVLQWNDPNKEFKSENIKPKQWISVLSELSTLEYSAYSIAFDKAALLKTPLVTPRALYFAAFRLLVDRVLDDVGVSSLYFDDYSNNNSAFMAEFEKYIRENAAHYPSQKIEALSAVSSIEDPGVQLADIVCGAIKRGLIGPTPKLLKTLGPRLVEMEKFP